MGDAITSRDENFVTVRVTVTVTKLPVIPVSVECGVSAERLNGRSEAPNWHFLFGLRRISARYPHQQCDDAHTHTPRAYQHACACYTELPPTFFSWGVLQEGGGTQEINPTQKVRVFSWQRALIETVALALSVSLSHGSFSLDKAVE